MVVFIFGKSATFLYVLSTRILRWCHPEWQCRTWHAIAVYLIKILLRRSAVRGTLGELALNPFIKVIPSPVRKTILPSEAESDCRSIPFSKGGGTLK